MPGTAPAPAPIHVRDAGSDTEMSAAALSHLRWQPADVTWQKVNSSIQQQFGLCYISSLPGNTIRGQTLHSQCSTRSQVMPCNLNTPPLLRDKCMASAVSGCRSCCEDLEWVTSRMLWGLTSCKTLSSCQFLLIVQLVTRYKLSKTFSVLVQYLLSVVKCKWHWPGCVCFFELSSAVNWSDKWTRKMIILGPILTSDLTETKHHLRRWKNYTRELDSDCCSCSYYWRES